MGVHHCLTPYMAPFVNRFLTPVLLALLVSPIASAATSPVAAPAAEKAAVVAGVKTLSPQAVVDAVSLTPVEGLREVRTSGQIVYFSADGKYLVAGDVIEVATQRNLTEEGRAQERIALLKASDDGDHVVYGPRKNEKKIWVFTDPACPYCQKLHEEVPKLVAAGISVEYLAWPRGGPRGPGYGQTQAVWCSKDRESAYDRVMSGEQLEVASCEHPIRKHFELGETLNVTGTPAVFGPDGAQLGGYVSADVIIEALEG